MKFFENRILIGTAILMASLTTQAFAASVSIPVNVIRQPSADLVGPAGRVMDPGEATSLARSGLDLSTLNPTPNKLWQNRAYPATDPKEARAYAFPEEGGEVRFYEHEAKNRFTYMGRVQSTQDPSRYYRLSLSLQSHATLLRAALMRKLGYFVPAPKYYQSLTIRFSSKEELDSVVTYAEKAIGVDFASRDWVKARDDQRFTVTFAHVILEPALPEYFDAHWAFLPDPENPRLTATIEQLSRYRAFRALVVPLVLADIPESVNRFSAKAGSVYSDNVILTHFSAKTFGAVSYEDARWIMRRVAKLSEADWSEIVQAAHLPPEIDTLVRAKIIHRALNLLELFSLSQEKPLTRPELTYTTPSGLIRDGLVTKEFLPGYPVRWSHGERESPYNPGDLRRYLTVDTVSTGIKKALEKLNDKLQVQTPADVAAKREAEIRKRVQEHIRTRPWEPLYQPVESWGGFTGGFNADASRHISTGTYNESNAAIQLVDDVSVSGTIGYFRALDGFSGYFPTAGGNLSLVRNYTHVRPLGSVKEGVKEPWSNLYIPGRMNKLGEILAREATTPPPATDKPATGAGEGQAPRPHPLDEFLSELKDGEVFTISDTLVMGAYLQNVSPIHVLAGLAPFNFADTLSFGVDASRVVLRQTVFVRTANGIQIFLRGMRNSDVGAQFDTNLFLNFLRMRSSLTRSDVKTEAFVINYSSDLAKLRGDGKGDAKAKFDKLRTDLQAALQALFLDNNSEILEARFKHRRFDLDHDLQTTSTTAKLFLQRMSGFHESHTLRLRYPANPDYPDLKPEDEEVTLFSYKQGKLMGRDALGFLFDFFEGLIKKPGLLSRVNNPNPANVPFGKAYWRTVNTEVDLTAQGDRYPSVGIIQHVWGGWHLSKEQFLAILETVTRQFKDLPIGTYRIIEPEAFATLKSVDFYRITASTTLFQAGLDRVKGLLLEPKTDLQLYGEIMKLLGNGDARWGEQLYLQACKEEKNPDPTKGALLPARYIYQGTSYECLSYWMQSLLKLRAQYPTVDRPAQTRWMNHVLGILEENIPLPTLLAYAGRENYLFFVRVNGFRSGDEDGDLEFFSNTSGDPAKDFDTANGLFSLYAGKTGILPVEIDRSNGSFR